MNVYKYLFVSFIIVFMMFVSCGDEDGGQVSQPVITPDGGTGDYLEVTITTATDNAEIRYTTDGSMPTAQNGEIYSGIVPVYKTMVITAIAYKDGMSDSDAVTSNLYTINPVTVTIDSDNIVGLNPSLAVSGSNVYISYYDSTNGYLKFARSTDGGASWNPENIITLDSGGSMGSCNSISADGNNVYISYNDSLSGEILFAKSEDCGATWLSSPEIQHLIVPNGYYNSIYAQDGIIYLAFWDNDESVMDLKFTKSTDDGATWPAGNIKTVDSDGETGVYPSMAVDGSNIYISYLDASNFDLKFARSADGGASWLSGPAIDPVVDGTDDVGQYSSIAVDGSNIYISYYDETNDDLKFAKSEDGGESWLLSPDIDPVVDSDGSVGEYPSLVADGSNLYIAYKGGSGGPLRFVSSSDGGSSWPSGNFKTVNTDMHISYETSMIMDGNNLYIACYDYVISGLKFAKSTDRGNSWE